MTTEAAAPSHSIGDRPPRTVDAHLAFGGVLRAELLKLLSLRSTGWTLGLTVVVMTLFGLLQAYSLRLPAEETESAGIAAPTHGAEVVIAGYQMGAVTIAVLGALMITAEYSTGMIRSTLTAVPTRLPVLLGKTIALGAVTVAVSALSLALTFLVTTPLLSDYELVPALHDERTWQIFGGMGFFLLTAALFALGIGAVLRSTAGTITVVLVVLLLLPGVLEFIKLDWVQDIAAYLPLQAAAAFLSVTDGPKTLGPWQGATVVAAYPIAALVAGAAMLQRRDA